MEISPVAAPVIIHPRGILFDMDGVLVSSIGSVERTWEKWAVARGVDPELAIRMAHGRRAIETVRELRPDLNDLEELRWLEEMEVADKTGVSMLDGVRHIRDRPHRPQPPAARRYSCARSHCLRGRRAAGQASP
jgi:sugar-phosphatase